MCLIVHELYFWSALRDGKDEPPVNKGGFSAVYMIDAVRVTGRGDAHPPARAHLGKELLKRRPFRLKRIRASSDDVADKVVRDATRHPGVRIRYLNMVPAHRPSRLACAARLAESPRISPQLGEKGEQGPLVSVPVGVEVIPRVPRPYRLGLCHVFHASLRQGPNHPGRLSLDYRPKAVSRSCISWTTGWS